MLAYYQRLILASGLATILASPVCAAGEPAATNKNHQQENPWNSPEQSGQEETTSGETEHWTWFGMGYESRQTDETTAVLPGSATSPNNGKGQRTAPQK